MKEEYVPAVITAIAAILGIIINIAINALHRFNDNRIKVKESRIESLETFYVPLCRQLENMCSLLRSCKESHPKKSLSEIYQNSSNLSTEYQDQIRFENIINSAKGLYDFIIREPYKYIDDYKAKFFYDRISSAFENDGTIKISELDAFFYNMERLVKRINKFSISLHSKNFVYEIYTFCWLIYRRKN